MEIDPAVLSDVTEWGRHGWRLLGWLGWAWAAYALVLAGWLVLQKRPPASTLAWMLALTLMPGLGLVIYQLFGPQRIKRQQFKRLRSQAGASTREELQALRTPSVEPPLWAVQHARLIEQACGLPPATATRADILDGGQHALDAILAAVAAAREHVHLEYYIFEPDQSGRALLAALAERARAGVQVRLLVDAVGSGALLARRHRALLADLRAAGAELAVFHPTRLDRWRPLVNLRTHRKLVVCDGWVGLTGGINITDAQHAGYSDTAWRDTHLHLEGPVVRWLQYVFLQDWAYSRNVRALAPEWRGWLRLPGAASGGARTRVRGSATLRSATTGVAPLPPTPDDGAPPAGPAASAALAAPPAPRPATLDDVTIAQIVASGPDTPGQAIHRAFIHATNLALHRVWLATPYFVPTESLLTALTNAALRGLDVRLMTPARADSRVVSAATRSYDAELLEAGVRIYRYGPRMLHAKTLLVDDDYAWVGSANADYRSFFLNFEVGVVLYSRAANERLAAMFAHDQATACREVTHKGREPFVRTLEEAVARLFSPLL